MDALITAENLVKLYQMGDETVRALDGVSFVIPRGAYCAIPKELSSVCPKGSFRCCACSWSARSGC